MTTDRHRILVLEDNLTLAKTLQAMLHQYLRVEIKWSDQVERSIELIDQKSFDIIIADWLLGTDCGLDVVNYAKQFHHQTKILMLTQMKQTCHRIEAYQQGADAYLAKPFNSNELLLLVRKLLTVYKTADNKVIKYKKLCLYPDEGRIIIGGQAQNLRPKEAKILKLLMVNSPMILGKGKILNLVWPNINHRPHHNTVEVYIRRIRKKLGPYAASLKNKRCCGYYLAMGNEQ